MRCPPHQIFVFFSQIKWGGLFWASTWLNNDKLIPDLLVDVHGEYGGAGVEDGCEGGHEGGEHDGEQESPQSHRQCLVHQLDEGNVGATRSETSIDQEDHLAIVQQLS